MATDSGVIWSTFNLLFGKGSIINFFILVLLVNVQFVAASAVFFAVNYFACYICFPHCLILAET